MAEIIIRLNKIYGKFYDRNEGIKIYRANFGGKFSDAKFKRASEAIDYKSRVMLRYMNLNTAQKSWLNELEKEKAIRANIHEIEIVFVVTLLPVFIILIGYLLLANH